MSPKKQEKLFHKDYCSELLRIAEGDWQTANVIRQADGARLENSFFMCQQAIEKGLKAVLVHYEIAVPLVHELGALLAKLPDSLSPPFGYELNELNQYASIRRYEEGQFDIEFSELDHALNISREMLDWCFQVTGH